MHRQSCNLLSPVERVTHSTVYVSAPLSRNRLPEATVLIQIGSCVRWPVPQSPKPGKQGVGDRHQPRPLCTPAIFSAVSGIENVRFRPTKANAILELPRVPNHHLTSYYRSQTIISSNNHDAENTRFAFTAISSVYVVLHQLPLCNFFFGLFYPGAPADY